MREMKVASIEKRENKENFGNTPLPAIISKTESVAKISHHPTRSVEHGSLPKWKRQSL